MIRTWIPRSLSLSAALLACAGFAWAQSGSASGQATGEGSAAVQTVESKAGTQSRINARAEAKLAAAAKQVDKEVGVAGESKVAGRLAGEFGVTAEALLAEQEELEVSWGELMIAHTLEASARNNVRVDHLIDLRADGMGWGQIAAGLNLDLGQAVSAVQAEARVASGTVRADGRVASIGLAFGHGANVGAKGEAQAGVGAGTDAGAAGAAVNSSVNAGVGVGASLPRIGGR
jgi:hypothetical protein